MEEWAYLRRGTGWQYVIQGLGCEEGHLMGPWLSIYSWAEHSRAKEKGDEIEANVNRPWETWLII